MDAFPYLFQTSILLLILSVGYYLLLRRETFFQANRLVLWFSLLGALLLPLLELPDFRPAKLRALEATIRQQLSRAELPDDSEARLASPIEKLTIAPPTRQVPIMNLPPGNKPQVQLDTLAVPASPTNWIILLVSLYYLVASVLLIRFLMQLYSLFNLLRQSEQTNYEEFTLITSPSINSPFSFFKWVALNPAQHTPDEQEQILRHERVHVRQWHSLDTLAAEVLCIVFWFNPGAWLFRRLIHQTLEYIADRAVLQEGIDARAYQYNLVKVTLSANSPIISNHFSRSELKDRIRMINRHRSGWRAGFKYPLLAVLVLGRSMAFIQPKAVKLRVRALAQMQSLAKQLTIEAEPLQPAIPASATITSTVTTTVPMSLTVEQAQPETVPTASDQPSADTIRVSPSRYLQYVNNSLYWLVTPKTTLEDLTIIKNELAKYNYQFKLLELQKDPLGEYIHFVKIKVFSPKGGSGTVDFAPKGVEPTPSRIGFISLTGSSLGVGGNVISSVSAPESLKRLAQTDEDDANSFYKSHRVDYLIEEGEKLRHSFGGYTKSIKTSSISSPESIIKGLDVKSDGAMAITDNEQVRDVRFFLNNEPYNTADIEQLKIGQLAQIIVEGNSWSTPKAIFLYTKN